MKRFMFLVALVVLVSASIGACTNASSAKHALEAQGLTDVTITGYKPLTCGQSDWSSTGFEATNAQGARVTGVVCCGLVFKNCTIRW